MTRPKNILRMKIPPAKVEVLIASHPWRVARQFITEIFQPAATS
jgi:hypothetical protein